MATGIHDVVTAPRVNIFKNRIMGDTLTSRPGIYSETIEDVSYKAYWKSPNVEPYYNPSTAENLPGLNNSAMCYNAKDKIHIT